MRPFTQHNVSTAGKTVCEQLHDKRHTSAHWTSNRRAHCPAICVNSTSTQWLEVGLKWAWCSYALLLQILRQDSHEKVLTPITSSVYVSVMLARLPTRWKKLFKNHPKPAKKEQDSVTAAESETNAANDLSHVLTRSAVSPTAIQAIRVFVRPYADRLWSESSLHHDNILHPKFWNEFRHSLSEDWWQL